MSKDILLLPPNPMEFYPTPAPFTRWLARYMAEEVTPITGKLFAPCVGDGAIVREILGDWRTNDLDKRWQADTHGDARDASVWPDDVDWTVDNPPFEPAIEIIEQALAHSRVGVAMHLRASIHEVLKTGKRRTWMHLNPPTGILWLPRFAYQRSRTTGQWSTDSVTACWLIWLKDTDSPQFIDYAPEDVLEALDAFTPEYRKRMDALMLDYHHKSGKGCKHEFVGADNCAKCGWTPTESELKAWASATTNRR